jgi:hypothetical protein
MFASFQVRLYLFYFDLNLVNLLSNLTFVVFSRLNSCNA